MGILGLLHCILILAVPAIPLQVFLCHFHWTFHCLVHLVQISCWALVAITHVEAVWRQTLFHFNSDIIIYFVFLTGNLRTWHWHSESHLRLAVTSAIVKFGDFENGFTSLRVLPIRAFLLAPLVTRAEESEQYINDQTNRDLGYILNSGLAGNWIWGVIWCRSPVFYYPSPLV